jgi:putative PIN family toxin of toxin-antitoxin system
MAPSRPDIVLDCNVFLQAVCRAAGPAADVLRLVERNEAQLHVSRPVLQELRRALAYPEIREKNPHVTDDVVNAFVARLSFRAVVHRDVPRIFDFPRDPSDEAYVDLAAVASAHYIVTRDNDLLSLATGHDIAAKQFRQRFPSLTVVTPVGFLSEIESRRR